MFLLFVAIYNELSWRREFISHYMYFVLQLYQPCRVLLFIIDAGGDGDGFQSAIFLSLILCIFTFTFHTYEGGRRELEKHISKSSPLTMHWAVSAIYLLHTKMLSFSTFQCTNTLTLETKVSCGHLGIRNPDQERHWVTSDWLLFWNE